MRLARLAQGLLTLALLALTAGCATARTPEWQRAWRVEGFECPRCDAEQRAWLAARRGEVVAIAPDRFTNPLYEGCPAGVDYADIRPRSPAEAGAFLGPGRLPPLRSAAPLAGLVRCAAPSGPPNTLARIVIDGTDAFLLHESGAVVTLR